MRAPEDLLDRPAVRAAVRAGAVGCLVLLAVLSLMPRDHLVRSGAPGPSEHLVAYCGTALVCLAAGRGRLPALAVAAALVAYGALLELLQLLVPGREARLVDALASAAGVGAGLVVAALWRRRFGRDGVRARGGAAGGPPAGRDDSSR